MTLLNAPAYDPKKERKTRNLIIGSGLAVVLFALFGVSGYLLGHGWFFDDMRIEHHVGQFLGAVQANDLDRAYGIWLNDPEWKQHPQNPNYNFKRFQEDWGPHSQDGNVKSYKVDISKRDGTGCIVAVKINGRSKPLFLWYERSNGKMSYSPLELGY